MTYVVAPGGAVARAAGPRNSYPFKTSNPREIAPQRGRVMLLDALSRTMTYEAMYRSQPWVYAVVNKFVNGISRLPLKTYVLGEHDERERAERGNDLDRLIRRPYPRGTAWHLKAAVVWDLMVHGQAAVLVSGRAGAPPEELYPVPWRHVSVIEDESGVIGYLITLPSGRYVVDPGRVLHFELPGRVSPLEPLRRTLAVEDAALTWQGENFRNGITPRGAFVTEGRLNDATLPRLREELESLYAGPGNAGRFGMFDQGLKWAQMGVSAVDAALIDQRKLGQIEVCAAYDVPPPAVGILDRATFANITELRKQLHVDAFGPKCVLLESTFNAHLVAQVAAWDGFFLEFDMDGVLRPDAEARGRAYLMEQQSSTSTINERRRRDNLPPIDDPAANTVLIPANMTPIGVEAATPASSAPAPTEAPLVDALTTEAFRAGSQGDAIRTVPITEEELTS